MSSLKRQSSSHARRAFSSPISGKVLLDGGATKTDSAPNACSNGLNRNDLPSFPWRPAWHTKAPFARPSFKDVAMAWHQPVKEMSFSAKSAGHSHPMYLRRCKPELRHLATLAIWIWIGGQWSPPHSRPSNSFLRWLPTYPSCWSKSLPSWALHIF